jgi:hypothetical protein
LTKFHRKGLGSRALAYGATFAQMAYPCTDQLERTLG